MADQVTVEQLAYRFWEEEGQPEGKALEHWLRAEATAGAEVRPAARSSQRRSANAEGSGGDTSVSVPPV